MTKELYQLALSILGALLFQACAHGGPAGKAASDPDAELCSSLAFATATWHFSTTRLPEAGDGDLFAVERRYYRRVNDAIHEAAPQVKTFLHSCGAIYDILDLVIDSGFDVVNPVQWTAGGHSYREWKDRCRNRIALWGGGVNAQQTLVLGTVEDVDKSGGDRVRQFFARRADAHIAQRSAS